MVQELLGFGISNVLIGQLQLHSGAFAAVQDPKLRTTVRFVLPIGKIAWIEDATAWFDGWEISHGRKLGVVGLPLLNDNKTISVQNVAHNLGTQVVKYRMVRPGHFY